MHSLGIQHLHNSVHSNHCEWREKESREWLNRPHSHSHTWILEKKKRIEENVVNLFNPQVSFLLARLLERWMFSFSSTCLPCNRANKRKLVLPFEKSKGHDTCNHTDPINHWSVYLNMRMFFSKKKNITCVHLKETSYLEKRVTKILEYSQWTSSVNILLTLFPSTFRAQHWYLPACDRLDRINVKLVFFTSNPVRRGEKKVELTWFVDSLILQGCVTCTVGCVVCDWWHWSAS